MTADEGSRLCATFLAGRRCAIRDIFDSAVPGVLTVGVSAAYWGHGGWPLIAQWEGMALVVLPLPLKPKKRSKASDPGASHWTGVR